MTREEAIEVLKKNRPGADPRRCGLELCTAVDVAIAALREQVNVVNFDQFETVTNRNGLYTTHEVACIIAELFGDDCACNFNDIDEWLPEKCELLDACPNTVGVACWEQYLKHKEGT